MGPRANSKLTPPVAGRVPAERPGPAQQAAEQLPAVGQVPRSDGDMIQDCSLHPQQITRGVRLGPRLVSAYSLASMAAASRSRSTYGSPLTSTATRRIVPPVKRHGALPG